MEETETRPLNTPLILEHAASSKIKSSPAKSISVSPSSRIGSSTGSWSRALSLTLTRIFGGKVDWPLERRKELIRNLFPSLPDAFQERISNLLKAVITHQRIKSGRRNARLEGAATVPLKQWVEAFEAPDLVQLRMEASDETRASLEWDAGTAWQHHIDAEKDAGSTIERQKNAAKSFSRTQAGNKGASLNQIMQPFESEVTKKSKAWLNKRSTRYLKISYSSGLELYKKKDRESSSSASNSEKSTRKLEFSEISGVTSFAKDECTYISIENNVSGAWVLSCSEELVAEWKRQISTYCAFQTLIDCCVKRKKAGLNSKRDDWVEPVVKRFSAMIEQGAYLQKAISVPTNLLTQSGLGHLKSNQEHQSVNCMLFEVIIMLSESPYVQSKDFPSKILSVAMSRVGKENQTLTEIAQGMIRSYSDIASNCNKNLWVMDDGSSAVLGSASKILQVLVNQRLPLTISSDDGYKSTLLMLLCNARDTNGVKTLLEAVSKTGCRDEIFGYVQKCNVFGDSALTLALKAIGSLAHCDITLEMADLCELLLPYANVHHSDSCGDTTLHLAIKSCRPAVDPVMLPMTLSLIQKFKAELNVVDHLGNSTLHLALFRRQYSIVKQVLVSLKLQRKNWNHTKNSEKSFGFLDLQERGTMHTAMTLALQQGCESICCDLLDLGASADVQGLKWCLQSADNNDLIEDDPIHVAIKTGNLKVALKLIECGACVSRSDSSGLPPILLAIRHGMYSLAHLIARQGLNGKGIRIYDAASMSIDEDYVVTASAILCIINGQLELACYLLDQQMSDKQSHRTKSKCEDVLFPTYNGHSILHTMIKSWVMWGDEEKAGMHHFNLTLLEELISTVLSSSESMINAVENASEKKKIIFKDSSTFAEEIDAVCSETPLHILLQSANDFGSNLLSLLLKKKVDFSLRNSLGESLLVVAIKSKWLFGISELLETCPSLLDIQDRCGDFPLHTAVKQALKSSESEKNVQILDEMLKHSPHKEAWDQEGRCITHLCVLSETDENGTRVCNILETMAVHQMTLCETTELGETPLSLAVEYGQEYSMKAIFRFGKHDIREQQCDSRQTVVHLALQVLRKDKSKMQRCMLEELLDEAKKLPPLSRKVIYDNALGISLEDAFRELNQIMFEMPPVSPRRRKQLPSDIYKEKHQVKYSDRCRTLPTITRTDEDLIELRRPSAPISPTSMKVSGDAVVKEAPKSKKGHKINISDSSAIESFVNPLPSPGEALEQQLELENLVLTYNSNEEQELLSVIELEAEATAKEWLKKRAGKQKMRTEALILQQQAPVDKDIPDDVALAEAERIFLTAYVTEAVSEAKQEIDRERRDLLQEFSSSNSQYALR